MISELKYKKELEGELPLDFFLIEKTKISKTSKKNAIAAYKNIEKHFALLPIRYTPNKPISKLLDPNDF